MASTGRNPVRAENVRVAGVPQGDAATSSDGVALVHPVLVASGHVGLGIFPYRRNRSGGAIAARIAPC